MDEESADKLVPVGDTPFSIVPQLWSHAESQSKAGKGYDGPGANILIAL